MTHLSEAVATDRAAVRVVYDEQDLSLLDLNDRVYELGCLVMINRMVVPELSAQTGQQIDFTIDLSNVLDAGDELRRTQVASVRQQSPLEIVFFIGATVTAGTYAGRRLLSLYNSFNDARVHKARSDLAVEIFESLTERIESTKFLGPEERRQATELIDGAAKAIASIDRMEIVEDGEPG